MPNLVLYRKYRPQIFAEVIGQDHIIRTLTNAIKEGEVSHAYLFAGPRGTGKTTVARLLAKAVNCEDGTSFEPCNKCSSCQEFLLGQFMDLIEIDAASNRGIDEVRELRELVRTSPIKARYKVFIIDETHMLTKEAFNALLKTLEEPPEHAIFVLATTEINKVPATIISRTQRFDFKKINLADLVKRLETISQKEKIKIEPEALKVIALNADGAARDAESLLSQIISFEGGRSISKKDIEDILGLVDTVVLEEFTKRLAQKNTKETFSYIAKLVEGGYSLDQFAKSLINYLREILLFKVDPNLRSELSFVLNDEQLGNLKLYASQFSEEDLKRLIELFIRAGNEIKRSNLPQLPLELAVVEYVHS